MIALCVGNGVFPVPIPPHPHSATGDSAHGVAKSRPRGFSPCVTLGECLPDMQAGGYGGIGKGAH